jgi:hypothetical protein
MFFNTLTTYDGQMKREYTSDSHFQDLLWWSCLTRSELLPGPIMATPKLPHLHCMEMHTVLLHPWNTNSETTKSMQKRTKIGKMQ